MVVSCLQLLLFTFLLLGGTDLDELPQTEVLLLSLDVFMCEIWFLKLWYLLAPQFGLNFGVIFVLLTGSYLF